MSSGSEVTRCLDFSSCICDDQNSYFKPEQELFLTPSKFSFFPKPNQTVSTVLSQQKIKKLNQKKCKRGRTRLLSMRLTETHLHIDDEVTL